MNSHLGRIAALSLALAAMLTGCGGSMGPHPNANSPVISNLITIGAGRRFEFDYADPNGDVRGGHVCNGPSCLDVPSADVTITGTTVGRITVRFPIFGSRIYLFDDAGNVSNTIEAGT